MIDQGSSGGGDGSYKPTADPTKPCVGNPIKNPEIAAQLGASGIDGGRVGNARKNKDGSVKPHKGLDVENSLGDPVYSMYAGTIYANGTSSKLGHYSIVQSTINGKTVLILYAHLKNKPVTSQAIAAGAIVGIAGKSGNLAQAILEKTAVQHLHIEVQEGAVWDSATSIKKDAEEYVTTKFDSNGKAIESTKC